MTKIVGAFHVNTHGLLISCWSVLIYFFTSANVVTCGFESVLCTHWKQILYMCSNFRWNKKTRSQYMVTFWHSNLQGFSCLQAVLGSRHLNRQRCILLCGYTVPAWWYFTGNNTVNNVTFWDAQHHPCMINVWIIPSNGSIHTVFVFCCAVSVSTVKKPIWSWGRMGTSSSLCLPSCWLLGCLNSPQLKISSI